MLATMRKNSRNAIIYVLFGILIAAFIISFGPGSRGFGVGGSGSSYAVKVAGTPVSDADFHFAFAGMGYTRYPPQLAREYRLREFLLDKLVEREIQAQEAERLGFRVSSKEAEDSIYSGRMYVLGVPQRVDTLVFKDGKFDYERFKTMAQYQLGVPVARFIEIQQRELLADKLRESMRGGVKVSADDVKADFEQKGLQVNLEYARYTSRRYEEGVGEPGAAEVDAYVKAHGAELKKQYDERAFLYKNLDKQARLRHVVVDAKKDAPAAEAQAAKARIEAAQAKLKAGTSFADVAKSFSSDERTRGRGGEIGWRKKGLTGLGDAIEAKIFAAKPGTVIGPERSERGFELVEVEGFREGDVPLAEAEKEMATEELRRQKAKDKAKAEAQVLVDRVKKGEKLEVVVPKEEANAAETAEQKQMRALMEKPGEPVHLQETGLFSRRGDMVEGVGVSKDLAQRAFQLKVGEVAGPFDVNTGWVVVRVKEHRDPDLADFEKRKAELMRQYERTKWAELLDGWSKQKCVALKDEGRIKVNDEVLQYDAGAKTPTRYEPCSQGAAGRLF